MSKPWIMRYTKDYRKDLEENHIEDFVRHYFKESSDDWDAESLHELFNFLTEAGVAVSQSIYTQVMCECILGIHIYGNVETGGYWLKPIRFMYSEYNFEIDDYIESAKNSDSYNYNIYKCNDGDYLIGQEGVKFDDLLEGINYEKDENEKPWTKDQFTKIW